MRLLGNILWLVFHGLWAFVGYSLAGFIWCLTVVGIPFGLASFRLAGFSLWPFGRTVVDSPTRGTASTIGNILWFVFSGFWLALIPLLGGAILCLTIIGIPFGIQAFKIAALAIAPLGRQVVPAT